MFGGVRGDLDLEYRRRQKSIPQHDPIETKADLLGKGRQRARNRETERARERRRKWNQIDRIANTCDKFEAPSK